MASPGMTHNYGFALETYMLLQEQYEELSNHLEQIRPRQPPASTVSTRSSSISSHCLSSPSTERRPTRARARCSGWDDAHRGADPLGTIVDEETLCEISAKERRLLQVNESIKRALTELLNCHTVRGDNSMRMWAQARLMETEKELRSWRRRRSIPSTE